MNNPLDSITQKYVQKLRKLNKAYYEEGLYSPQGHRETMQEYLEDYFNEACVLTEKDPEKENAYQGAYYE